MNQKDHHKSTTSISSTSSVLLESSFHSETVVPTIKLTNNDSTENTVHIVLTTSNEFEGGGNYNIDFNEYSSTGTEYSSKNNSSSNITTKLKRTQNLNLDTTTAVICPQNSPGTTGGGLHAVKNNIRKNVSLDDGGRNNVNKESNVRRNGAGVRFTTRNFSDRLASWTTKRYLLKT